jgi:anti-sigma regulatory factor (Ser/Thr protein kinase)
MTRASGSSTCGGTEQGTVAVLADDGFDLEISAHAAEVAAARHAVAHHLRDHGVSSVVIDDIELVTSELVTNAIVHPRPTDRPNVVRLHVEVSDWIELSVANVGSAAAIPDVHEWNPVPPAAMSGRGLGIVRRLCDDVAVEQRGEHAVVSCRRHLPDGGVMP